jgi:hypothetical protein
MIEIQTKVQEDLNRIELWCKDNNMFINCNKTKCITVGTKQNLAFQNEELYLTINSEQLQQFVSLKYFFQKCVL